MKPESTSQEAILQAAREIVAEEGIHQVTMRKVASKCSIALGTFYNYYSNKNELLLAVIESVWRDIFHAGRTLESKHHEVETVGFVDYVESFFKQVTRGAQEYPGFLSDHSAAITQAHRQEGKEVMDGIFSHTKQELLTSLHNDPNVKKDTFTADFTEENFIEFVVDNLFVALTQEKQSNPTFLKVISKILY
ncbi:MAG: TetR/AcrR family transcriptional regulator [Anaerotardibacter sp.]